MRFRYWVWIIPWIVFNGASAAADVSSAQEKTESWSLRRLPSRIAARFASAQTADAGDWLIATRVRTALWRDKDLAAQSIEVVVRQGVATLYGPVPTEEHRQKAVEITRKASGVKDVRDLLRVREPRPTPAVKPTPFPPVDAPPANPQPGFPGVPRPKTNPSATMFTAQPRLRTPPDVQPPEWQAAVKPPPHDKDSSTNGETSGGSKRIESDWRPLLPTPGAETSRVETPSTAKPSKTRLLPPIVEP